MGRELKSAHAFYAQPRAEEICIWAPAEKILATSLILCYNIPR